MSGAAATPLMAVSEISDEQKHVLSRLQDAAWPDPVAMAGVVLDDVTRMNETAVGALIEPRTRDDIVSALAMARKCGARVSSRGTKHSMGGHSLVPEGVVIDMKWISHVRYNVDEGTVTAGAGATWADVIRVLNPHGKTPRTLQSYCSFSVGGTMAVNGHGITSDYCLAESVVRFTLVKADGSVEEVERSNELFGLVLGGYGLFGIVFEATLRVDDNVRLSLDTMALPLADFPHVYERVLNNGSSSTAAAGSGSGEAEVEAPVQMKLGRVDITTFDTAELFVFTRDAPTPSVGRLSHRPREMSAASRLMYKWLAGPLREARFALERNLGVALDWSTGVTDRNGECPHRRLAGCRCSAAQPHCHWQAIHLPTPPHQYPRTHASPTPAEMLFESAEPLAKLYSPLVTVDDTFVLQEFFVPRERFGEWVAGE